MLSDSGQEWRLIVETHWALTWSSLPTSLRVASHPGDTTSTYPGRMTGFWEWYLIGDTHQAHIWVSWLTSPKSDVSLGSLIEHIPGHSLNMYQGKLSSFCQEWCLTWETSSSYPDKLSGFPKSGVLLGRLIKHIPREVVCTLLRLMSHWQDSTAHTQANCLTSLKGDFLSLRLIEYILRQVVWLTEQLPGQCVHLLISRVISHQWC